MKTTALHKVLGTTTILRVVYVFAVIIAGMPPISRIFAETTKETDRKAKKVRQRHEGYVQQETQPDKLTIQSYYRILIIFYCRSV